MFPSQMRHLPNGRDIVITWLIGRGMIPAIHTPDSGGRMASPAAPFLTATDYRVILTMLIAAPRGNPGVDLVTERAIAKISDYLFARAAWEADARRRGIDNPW
jgi:hypothetical protein